MPPHQRVNWEFFAVIRGTCAPFFHDQPRLAPASRTLWLFPPNYAHGWVGHPGKTCEIVVLHFSSVPFAVEKIIREQGYLEIRLTSGEIQDLTRLAASLKTHYWRPVLVSDIYTDRALMEMSLLILRDSKGTQKPQRRGGSKLNHVLIAERWLQDHLAEQPSIRQAARAVGISTSQLRRLFVQVRQASPKDVLQKLKLEKALTLMSQSDAKLQSVASECGFSSASNFCRAFKAFHGSSPTAWRKEIYIQYKKPGQPDKADHLNHGRRLRSV